MLRIEDKYIIEIAKERSFSKAAEKLYIAQPSLSRYIINLEDKLGVKIFDRSKMPLEITEAGEKLIEYIYKCRELEREFLSEINRIKNKKSETEISIGIVPWRIPVFVPKIIPAFSEAYPNINVVITEDVSPNLENDVLNDKIDVCIINGPVINKNLEFHKLSSEKLILLVPKNSKVAADNYDFDKNQYKNSYIDIKSLENEKFVLLKENFRLGQISREIFKHHNINPKNIIEVSHMSTAMSMSSAGLGFTFIPESGIDRLSSGNNCLCFSIGQPSFGFPLVIAYKKEKYNNPNVRKFIDFVRENYKNII